MENRTIKKVFNFQPTVNHPSKTEQQRDEKVSIFCHLRSLWRKTFMCVYYVRCFRKKFLAPRFLPQSKYGLANRSSFQLFCAIPLCCKMCVQSNPVSIFQVLPIKFWKKHFFSLEIPSACINAVLRVKKTEKKFISSGYFHRIIVQLMYIR